jgi:hypothetical protein
LTLASCLWIIELRAFASKELGHGMHHLSAGLACGPKLYKTVTPARRAGTKTRAGATAAPTSSARSSACCSPSSSCSSPSQVRGPSLRPAPHWVHSRGVLLSLQVQRESSHSLSLTLSFSLSCSLYLSPCLSYSILIRIPVRQLVPSGSREHLRPIF